jgi:hypothetical protein
MRLVGALHRTPLNSFDQWQRAYYKLSSVKNTKYVRTDLFDEFDLLRKQVGIEHSKNHEDDRKAPFLFE